MQQQYMPQGPPQKRPRKKRSVGQRSRAAPASYSQRQRPPLGLSSRQQRPLTAAANKKYRRSKIAGNTISYEDEATRGGRAGALEFGLPPAGRTKHSSSASRRPMTAKNRRPAGFGRPPISGTVRRSKADAHIAATPNTRVRNKLSAKRSMIVPQQSQMFTSFGLPGSQQLSQRKASSKGRPGPYGTQKAKRMRRPQSGNNASNKRKRTETSAEM